MTQSFCVKVWKQLCDDDISRMARFVQPNKRWIQTTKIIVRFLATISWIFCQSGFWAGCLYVAVASVFCLDVKNSSIDVSLLVLMIPRTPRMIISHSLGKREKILAGNGWKTWKMHIRQTTHMKFNNSSVVQRGWFVSVLRSTWMGLLAN